MTRCRGHGRMVSSEAGRTQQFAITALGWFWGVSVLGCFALQSSRCRVAVHLPNIVRAWRRQGAFVDGTQALNVAVITSLAWSPYAVFTTVCAAQTSTGIWHRLWFFEAASKCGLMSTTDILTQDTIGLMAQNTIGHTKRPVAAALSLGIVSGGDKPRWGCENAIKCLFLVSSMGGAMTR